jgi:soluble lytic murein transglycosylase-like protein
MKFDVPVILSGAVLLIAMQTAPVSAEDKIQAFVNPSGKLVFTNLVDNKPAASTVQPVAGETSPSAEDAPVSLQKLIEAISANHGVDPALVRAVMKTESNFNRYAVSNKGALGLMQLIPSTGRRYGVRDFFDPQQNIDGGVRHLKFLLEKFNGNLDLSLAAYNAGENLVERLGRIPSIPETRNYVRKIRAMYKTKSTPTVATALPAATIAAATAPETPKIFKTVDARGIVHFSNIEPPN